jgi:tetratricopeptide (TPR) repeat protein
MKEIQIGWKEKDSDEEVQYYAPNNNGRSTAMNMLYTPIDYPSVDPNIGDDVICNFGRGRVLQIEIHDNDGNVTQQNDTTPSIKKKYTIALSKWRLNGGRKSVICYITVSSSDSTNTTTTSMLYVVRKCTVNEMSIPERIELAMRYKSNASEQFTSKAYDIALRTYAQAVSIARDRQHDPTTNELRADLVVLMITCSNNAATCCIKLQQYTEARKHAQNALILCDALYTKRNKKVHTVLRNDGLIDAKIFGEWRIKSYIIISHCALVENKGGGEEYDVIGGILKKAHGVAIEYINESNAATAAALMMNNTIEINKKTKLLVEEHASSLKSLTTQTKEIRRLLVECNSKKKTMKDVEKRRAKAMFASSSVSERKTSNDSTTTTTTTEDEKKEETKIWHPLMEDVTQRNRISVVKKVGDVGINNTKSVTFSVRPPQVKVITPQSSSTNYGGDDDNDDDREGKYDDDTAPWFVEHREALLVLAITGFTAITVLAFRIRRSS